MTKGKEDHEEEDKTIIAWGYIQIFIYLLKNPILVFYYFQDSQELWKFYQSWKPSNSCNSAKFVILIVFNHFVKRYNANDINYEPSF